MNATWVYNSASTGEEIVWIAFSRVFRVRAALLSILLGERDLRQSIGEFITHYHAERNHQRIGNELLQPLDRAEGQGRVRRRQRICGMLNYYYRAV